MGRRTLLLIAALVVAALGATLVWLYASNAQKTAQEGQTLTTVLVAKAKIDVGVTGSAASSNGAFEQAQVPASSVVPGALSDATPIANLVALVPVFPGQQIIGQQWGAAATTGGLAIPAGKIAISVQLSDPARVAGFVSPGSRVAIFTYGNADPNGAVRTLLSDVEVLAVGPSTTTTTASTTNGDGNTSATNKEQIPTAILTLALSQSDAEKVIYAGGAAVPGSKFQALYFGLMDKNSKVDTGSAGASLGNLFK
jgi:pilus assembly protein CpaB